MATSLIGPLLVLRASFAAPVPRPPQPTSATWIVLSSAAWTEGIATPARADTPTPVAVVFKKSRRVADGFGSVMESTPSVGAGIALAGPPGWRVFDLGQAIVGSRHPAHAGAARAWAETV